MTYVSFELERDEAITDEQAFREKACGTCLNKDICVSWEFETGQTLYANKSKGKNKPFEADDGTKGVYRCTSYSEEF